MLRAHASGGRLLLRTQERDYKGGTVCRGLRQFDGYGPYANLFYGQGWRNDTRRMLVLGPEKESPTDQL